MLTLPRRPDSVVDPTGHFRLRRCAVLALACVLVVILSNVGCEDGSSRPPGSPPTAADDSVTVDEDSSIIIDVISNDSDPDGDAITVVSVDPPAHGTAVLNADGTVTYDPYADWNGTEVFSYTLTDTHWNSDGTVTVTVTPVPDPPVAGDDSILTPEDTPSTFDVFQNDYDPDGDALSLDSVGTPSNGTLVQNGGGSLTYTPDADWNGDDTFTYTVSDGSTVSVGTVTVTVTSVPDPPVAEADPVWTPEDTPLTFDVFLNDYDPEGDSLFLDSVGTPSNGTLVQNGGGSLTYIPNADWNGDDTFTYTVSDGSLTAVGTITVTVTPLPDPPVAAGDSPSTPVDLAVNIDVLANDYEPDGEALVVDGTTVPSVGTVTVEVDGTVTYTPPAGFTGTATFDYTVRDPGGSTDTATVVVTVGAPVTLALTEARGLYRPDASGVGHYDPGYLSPDDLGRIYSNRAYDPADPGVPLWTKNRQYVDLTVALRPAGVVWPAEARIVWGFQDADDPSNEDPLTHSEAGETLDPNDYDGSDNDGDGTPDNSDGEDNTGSVDGRPAWEQIDAAWALSGGNETQVSGSVSGVRFNVTDDGGDNFRATVSVKLSAGDTPFGTVSTGIMTVWKRVNVEYVKMQSSVGLDGLVDGQANDAFAKCFVEMVPQPGAPRVVPDVVVSSKLQMGVNEYSAGGECDEYVTAADGEFSKEGEPGWFFAAAANHFVDATGSGSAPEIYHYYADILPDGETLWTYAEFLDNDKYQYGDKQADLGSPQPGYQVMQTDMIFSGPNVFQDGTVLYDYDPFADDYLGSAPIISHTQGNVTTGATITYGADSPAPDGEILVYKTFISAVTVYDPSDTTQIAMFMYRNFSWDPASWTFQVWPKGYSTPTQYDLYSFDLIDHGFSVVIPPVAYVQGTGALYVAGISPGPNGGLEGRTIVFTTAGGDLDTLTHEFGHAFGFHHICGNWDYRSHASGGACTMHYSGWYLMLNDASPRALDLWVYGDGSLYYCEQHVVAIRQQNLEDLAILGWGN